MRNVLAAGECRIRTHGKIVRLTEPEIVDDPELRLAPWLVRPLLGFDRVTKILRMRAEK